MEIFTKKILHNSRRSWCTLNGICCRVVPCVAAVLGITLHRNKYGKTQRQAWTGHFPHRRQSVQLLPSTAIEEWLLLCTKSILFSESQKKKKSVNTTCIRNESGTLFSFSQWWKKDLLNMKYMSLSFYFFVHLLYCHFFRLVVYTIFMPTDTWTCL